MRKEDFKEFEDYTILEFRDKDSIIFKYFPEKKSYGTSSSYTFPLRNMLYDTRCSVADGKLMITKIQKGDFVFSIGDKIKLPRFMASEVKTGIIEAFELKYDEIVVKLVKKDYFNQYVRIINIKHLNDASKDSDTIPLKTKDNASNELKDGFTLEDIKNVLSNILDDFELKEALNDFRKYKRLPVIENKVKSTFVLPENWYVVITEENRESVKSFIEPNHKSRTYLSFSYSIGATYGVLHGEKTGCSNTTNTRARWTEITTEQFEEHVLNKQEQKVTLPF